MLYFLTNKLDEDFKINVGFYYAGANLKSNKLCSCGFYFHVFTDEDVFYFVREIDAGIYFKTEKSALYLSANGSSLLFGKSFFLIIKSEKQLFSLWSETINSNYK